MTDDRNANVVLTADTSNYKRGMDEAQASTNKVLAGVLALNTAMSNLTSKGGRKLEIIGVAQIGAMTLATAQAAKLQQQMSQLNANSVMTGRSFDSVSRQVNSLRRDFAVTTDQATALATQLSKMGQSQSQIRQLSESFVRLSSVTGESISGLTDGLIGLQRQMGVVGAEYTNRFASALANVSANAGVSATSVLQFSNAIAPIGRVAGMSTNEILGVSTAFVKSGQDGYAAANAFNKMLTDITRSVQYGSPELKAYSNLIGVSVDQFKQLPRTEAVTRVFEAINKQGPDAIKTLERFGLDGIRTYRALQAVASTGGIRSAISDATAGYGDTSKFTDASNKALDGLNENLQQITNNLQMIGEAFGKGLIGPATMAASAVNGLLGPLGKLLNSLGAIPGLGGLAAGAGVLGAGMALRNFTRLTALGVGATVFRGPMAAGLLNAAGSSIGQGRLGGWVRGAAGSYEEGQGGIFQRGLYRAGSGIGAGIGMFRSSQVGEALGVRDLGIRGSLSRLGGLGVQGLGSFMRYGLEPLYASNLINPMNRNVMFPQNFKDTVSTYRDRVDAIHAFSPSGGTQGLSQSIRSQTTLFRALGAETIKLTGSLGRAALGTAGVGGLGLASGVGRLGMRAGAAAMNFLGGPIGLGLAAGTGLYAMHQHESNLWSNFRQDDSDNSSLSRYSAALGIAASATISFANVVKTSAAQAKAAGTPQTVAGALAVGGADAAIAVRGQFTDARVAGMSAQQATQFAAAALSSPSVDPRQAQLLKLDLVKRFGAGPAQSIIAQATRGGPLPNFFTGINHQFSLGPFGNNAFTQKGTSQQAGIAASNIQTAMAGANSTTDQSQLAIVAFNQAAREAHSSQNKKVRRAAAEGLAKGLGLKDSKSIDAIEASLQYGSGGLGQLASSGTTAGSLFSYARNNVGAGFNMNAMSFTPGAHQPGDVRGYSSYVMDSLRQSGGLADYVTRQNRLGGLVNRATLNQGDANLQMQASQQLALQFTKMAGSASDAIYQLQRMQAAIGNTSDPLYQLAAAAQAAVRQRQTEAMTYMSRSEQAQQLAGNYIASAKAARLGGPESRQQLEQDRQALAQGQASAYSFFQQIATQSRELNVSLQRGEEDMARTRARGWADFQRSRMRGEADFAKQRRRAEYDFNLSRTRQESDFNHQLVVMTRDAAREVYDIYTRINVQQTWSASNLLQNAQDQQGALNKQLKNLKTIRGMGVSGDVIQLLGLDQAQNAQQLARFTSDLLNDPAMVKAWNKAAKDRQRAAKKMVTDPDNEQWTEMRRSFNLNISRAQEDFNRGMDRQQSDFNTSLKRSREDYNISISRMVEDFARQETRAREDLNRMATEITGSFNKIAKLAIGSLSGTAKTQAQVLYDTFAEIKKKLPKIISDLIKTVANAAQQSANAAEHALDQALSGTSTGSSSANAAEHRGSSKPGSNQSIVQSMAKDRGWGSGKEWNALYNIIMAESGFRNTAQNPSSTAYGMFQFLKHTWATVGGHKTSDPVLQAEYGLKYIAKNYGDPLKAWAFHQSHGWYGQGSIFSGPQVIGVGEKGPEAVLPLNAVGGKFMMGMLREYMNTEAKNALLTKNSMISPSHNVVYNTKVDKSTHIDHVSVAAADPNDFFRKIEAKKRLGALTKAG